MPTTCTITFDNEHGVYYAGEMLCGNVALTLTSEIKVRGVFVKIFGRGYSYWTEYCTIDHNSTRNSRGNPMSSDGHYVSYVGKEDYINEETYFVGGENAEPFQLAPGTHDYAFQYQLPARLPTSVIHDIGHITYGVTVVMDIPMGPDKEFQEHFSVIKPIDLNRSSLFRTPARSMSEQRFYTMGVFCCCSDGPLTIKSRTPVQGYTPGQMVNVVISIDNESFSELIDLDVKLNKQIVFHGRANEAHHNESKDYVVNNTICEKMVNGCEPKSETTTHVNIRIPPIPPTDFGTSNIVKVRYTIRIAGNVESCCNSVKAHDLPITIGTIPIQDNFNVPSTTAASNQPASSQNGVQNSMADDPPSYLLTQQKPFPPVPTATNALNAPNFPTASTVADGPRTSSAPSPSIDLSENPPTYEEAMNMGNEGSHAGFRPKYPMFRRETSYSIDTSVLK